MQLEKWSDYLKYYDKEYGFGFKVQSFIRMPKNWVVYGTKDYKDGLDSGYNHRERLPNEVILDFDGDVKYCNKDLMKLICVVLDKDELIYRKYNSGGDGYHIHLTFDELLQYPKYERDELKKMIIKHLGYGHLTEAKKGDSHVCTSNVSGMIQIEKAYHRKGGYKNPLGEEKWGSNDIPHDIMKKFVTWQDEQKNFKPVQFKSNHDKPCIKYFLTENFIHHENCRDRVAFILAAHYHNTGVNQKEALELLQNWNIGNLNGYLREGHLRSKVGCVYRSDRGMGCRFIQGILDELGMRILCRGCRGNQE